MNRTAIVSAIGSRGDVNPMLALGRELKSRGWDITFLTSEPYKGLADAAGFESEVIIDSERFERFIHTPNLWNPFIGLRVVLGETASELIRPCFEIIKQRYRAGETLLVSHPLDFGARVFRDAFPTVPHAGVVLAPMAVRTPSEPARLTGWAFEARSPITVRAQYYLADRLFVDRWLGKPLNEFRSELGLAPIKRVLKDWYLSPDLVLGLFPDWFAPTSSLLPSQMRCTGFPLEDAAREMSGDQIELTKKILARFETPPVVFAPGTANIQAKQYFEYAAAACESLGCCGLLVTEHSEQLPRKLPPNVHHEAYAPFKALLPHCSGIVQHGGIGTTSQSLAAGIPQVVVPMAFDQFDNALRVERLGCGKTLFHKRLSKLRLTKIMEHVLSDNSIAENCRKTKSLLSDAQPVKAAVDAIEQMVSARKSESH